MMKQMEKDGIAFDEFTYSSVIVACGRGGQPRKSLELLDEMIQVHGEHVSTAVALKVILSFPPGV